MEVVVEDEYRAMRSSRLPQVLVAHSKVKPFPNSGTLPRTRPGNFGLVVMKSPQAVCDILAQGPEQATASPPSARPVSTRYTPQQHLSASRLRAEAPHPCCLQVITFALTRVKTQAPCDVRVCTASACGAMCVMIHILCDSSGAPFSPKQVLSPPGRLQRHEARLPSRARALAVPLPASSSPVRELPGTRIGTSPRRCAGGVGRAASMGPPGVRHRRRRSWRRTLAHPTERHRREHSEPARRDGRRP